MCQLQSLYAMMLLSITTDDPTPSSCAQWYAASFFPGLLTRGRMLSLWQEAFLQRVLCLFPPTLQTDFLPHISLLFLCSSLFGYSSLPRVFPSMCDVPFLMGHKLSSLDELPDCYSYVVYCDTDGSLFPRKQKTKSCNRSF